MALSSGKRHPSADPMMIDFDKGEFFFDDGTSIKLPANVKYVEQDPDKVNMVQPGSEKKPVKVIVNDKVSFIVIAGATKAVVLDGIKRCELGV